MFDRIPAELNEKNKRFFASSVMPGVKFENLDDEFLWLKILNGEADIDFGSVYENAVAQELFAHGFELNYYNSNKYGEVDFVLEKEGGVLPIEVKRSDGIPACRK